MMMFAVPLLALTALVANVDCNNWERLSDTQWRTESGAVIVLDDATILRVPHNIDVTEESAPDLHQTLESFCFEAGDGGQ